MSDDDDRISGFAASSRGGSPDWNSPGEVSAWQTAESFKALEAHHTQMTQSQSSTTSDDSMAWGLPSNDSSSSYDYSGSHSGRSSSPDIKVTWSQVLIGICLLAGGYAGYSFTVAYRGTNLELWLTTGGTALGAALLGYLLAEVIKGKLALSGAIGILVMFMSGLVSGFVCYWYAEDQHGSTAEVWLAAAIGILGAIFVWRFMKEALTRQVTLLRFGSILAMGAGWYAGHTYYDGTPLQDWLAGGVGALTVGFCAWITGETIKNVATQQPTDGSKVKKAKSK